MLTNEQREAIVDYFLGYKLLLLSFRGGGRRISDLPCQDEINVVRWEQLKYIQPSGKRKVVFVFRLTQTIVMNLIQLQCQPYPTFGRTKRGIRQDSESASAKILQGGDRKLLQCKAAAIQEHPLLVVFPK
ncbi:uncharacterized protein LOC111278849 isoform X5 [Durio zibethinus]|uniref:Uncharacterized protein LOC111278849 isoform X5 n=1 Tax=Durio zibethinus TaxID=66656 RepID=A0A6P5WYZ6_DURZI|nr:uncharacterized protein LOC111278849 isoform X5 [Durio zibethinus]